MTSAEGTIAVRIPDHAGLQELFQSVGCLFSTSANLSGEPIPESASEISDQLREKVDAVLVEEGVAYPQVPSTIIDVTKGDIVIIREGLIPSKEIKETFQ